GFGMRLGELTYLTDQIVTFGFSSLELRNKAENKNKKLDFSNKVITRMQEHEPVSDSVRNMFKSENKASLNERFKKAKAELSCSTSKLP
ncbi:hypothetical protein, partial [Vibrio cholerae]|uniref:hypothetical protein n=1 Tax=Vibrio cholerae TaxID=666 RepID=UPI001C8DF6F2